MNIDDGDDPDNPLWTPEDFKKARPTGELLGKAVESLLTRAVDEAPALRRQISGQSNWLTKSRLAA